MYIVKAEENQVEKIVDMSISAFETDVNVGGTKDDCPPEYDSVEWHKQMAREGHLYQAIFSLKRMFTLDKVLWTHICWKKMWRNILESFSPKRRSIAVVH